MSDPTPKEISIGLLDMSVRDLLLHMITSKLDHSVLIIPGTDPRVDMRVCVTIASEEETRRITKEVQRILTK